MTAIITLTAAGNDTGPFDIYSNVDNYLVPFETNVSKTVLLQGLVSSNIPNATTTIRIISLGVCKNSIDIILPVIVTTTTTIPLTTTTTASLTTTTTNPLTTTTTISPNPFPLSYRSQAPAEALVDFSEACTILVPSVLIYPLVSIGGVLNVGAIIYTNSIQSLIFNGNNFNWTVLYNDVKYLVTINGYGIISKLEICN